MNQAERIQRSASSPPVMAPQHPPHPHRHHHRQQQHHLLQQRVVGDYVLTHQVGSGSFAVVWKAHHRINGNEVAIKEIAAEKLNMKLHESLMSEIDILKRTNHPNIIRLHETIMASRRIFLVLEYCAGGDLAAYIQRHGRVSESVARHFMRQLGAGLQVLQANNLIHRDLKPQNLLLSTNDGNAVLKIADFGFARSLQPQGMAETLCGSPLYMAPEILQFKKYDAKADLWSVGTILYQLVTGQPPFVGQSPLQLLQHIQKSNEVQFPPSILSDLHVECIDLCRKLLRKDPVERLSFEEFFNHRFIAQPVRYEAEYPIAEGSLFPSRTSKSTQEESLPFPLDEDPQVSPTDSIKKNMLAASPPFSFLQSPVERASKKSTEMRDTFVKEITGNFSSRVVGKETRYHHTYLEQNPKIKAISNVQAPDSCQTSPLKGALLDSMECLEREYVVVNVPLSSTETMSMSASDFSPSKNPQKSSIAAISKQSESASLGVFRSIGSPSSLSETSECSVDSTDVTIRSSTQLHTRLERLQRYAEAITEVANERVHVGQHLEAFSIQLVCLAIWKEALDVCRKWTEHESCSKGGGEDLHSIETLDEGCRIALARSHVEQCFLIAVEQAESFAPHLYSLDGNAEVPDAIEVLYQSALTTGRNAGVDELMGNTSSAGASYSRAATLLHFILTEAVQLPVTPRLILSPLDQQRLHHYIDILSTRQSQCADFKVE